MSKLEASIYFASLAGNKVKQKNSSAIGNLFYERVTYIFSTENNGLVLIHTQCLQKRYPSPINSFKIFWAAMEIIVPGPKTPFTPALYKKS